MDSSLPSTSTSDPSDHGDARNGEGLAIDEIMRRKEKRLKLLDDYRNEQEDSLLPLMREAEDITRKRKKKARSQLPAENNIPLRRSERIMTQTLNENGTIDSPMHEPQPEPDSVSEPQHAPEFEPEPAPREEFEPEPMVISEPESAAANESESESESEDDSELETGTENDSDSEQESPPSDFSEPDPLYTDESELELDLRNESEQDHALTDDSEQDALPGNGHVVQRGSSPRQEFEVHRPSRHIFDVQLASRRVFAVHPAPMQDPLPLRRWRHPAFDENGNWYGPRQGFDIGYHWNTRLECSHDRVHRPSIAGIHAGPYGAYSVALSGAYPEDIDRGNVVIFTGAGGRDLRGRRGRSRSVRSAPQVRDQELNKANLSLIKSMRTGNPVRLIRGYKLASSFAPEYGYRYDGLYRVVHFCYTRGHSGFRVFRFKMFRLENQTPPPWETEGRGATPRRMLPPARTPRPSTSAAPRRRRRPRTQSNRVPSMASVRELDAEIAEYIRKLIERSQNQIPDDDDGDSSGPFRGWNSP